MSDHLPRPPNGVAPAVVLPENANTRDLLKALIDEQRAKGIPMARREIGILAQQTKQLLEDGFSADTLMIALRAAVMRNTPDKLWRIAGDIARVRAGERRMSWREYERAVEDAAELDSA